MPKQLKKKELEAKKNFLKAAKIDDKRIKIIVLFEMIDEKESNISFIYKRIL